MPMELFSFPFLFPSFCHSVIYRVVSVVSDGRNKSSFVFFYVVLDGCVKLSSMMAIPLPPSFLGTYSRSTSSLGCNALCIVISFLVLWSIFLSSSLVHLRKGPEYLMRGTAQVFISLIRFLQESFVTSSFLILLRFLFAFFFHFDLFDSVSLQDT